MKTQELFDRDYVLEEGVILLGGVLGASGMLLLLRGAYLLVRRLARPRPHASRRTVILGWPA